MGSTKHERSFVDYDKSYETNIIGLRGIVYFGIGVVLLIIITFGLMLVLQNVLEDQAKERDAQSRNPMLQGLKKEDRLPPEPRLQSAPGFGVGDVGKERINLELKAPQSELWALEKEWEKIWKEGQKDPQTGTVVTLPIEDAKRRLLEENVKARSGPEAMKTFEESRTRASYSSAGRLYSDKSR
jgi:hypothetical protein